MKAYTEPELICRCFRNETVVTESGADTDNMTAVEAAQVLLTESEYNEQVLLALW